MTVLKDLTFFDLKRWIFTILSTLLLLSLVACGAAMPQATAQGQGSPAAATTVEVATTVPTPTLTPTAAPLPTLTPLAKVNAQQLFVDAAVSQGPVNPQVFGTNYGPWLFVPLEVRPQAVAAKFSVLRFPGGNWGDLNDLDPWSIDQYISLCKELGSEPFINVRLKGGTPEAAAELVKYVNVTKKYAVKYWGIGNEPNLYPNYTIEQYNQDWPKYAAVMREVDPSILLIGPETNQFTANLAENPKDKAGRDWLEEFLKVNGDKVDIVAVHRYPFPKQQNEGSPAKADLLNSSAEWDEIIPALRALVREHTGKDLPVAVTEVNSSWATSSGGETSMDSFYNALWWGDALGRMIRQGTEMVTQFAIVGDYGVLGKYDVYPMYYIYQMYQHFGNERLLATSPDAQVSIFAARNKAEALTVMLINRGNQAKTLPLKVNGFTCNGNNRAWLFDAQHKAEAADAAEFYSGEQVTLPPESMLLIELGKK